MLEGGHESTKIGRAMGVTIGVDAGKSGKNTSLLVKMRVSLLKKIDLLNLMNRTQFKKRNG